MADGWSHRQLFTRTNGHFGRLSCYDPLAVTSATSESDLNSDPTRVSSYLKSAGVVIYQLPSQCGFEQAPGCLKCLAEDTRGELMAYLSVGFS